jgi:hypothetical protein
MSALTKRTALSRLSVAAFAVLCLGTALSVPKPAEARIWVGVNFGYPGYYYAPSYYYPAYYPYYGHRHYWRYRHHYRHAHYWRHHHWCNWHPYRCYG